MQNEISSVQIICPRCHKKKIIDIPKEAIKTSNDKFSRTGIELPFLSKKCLYTLCKRNNNGLMV